MDYSIASLTEAVVSLPGFTGSFTGEPRPTSMAVQGHHLIPNEVASGSWLLKAMTIIEGAGYNQNSFQTNGIWLPSKASDAYSTGISRHVGEHPAYSKFVMAILDQMETSVRAQIAIDVANGVSEDQAIRAAFGSAKLEIDKLQLFLKSGMVSQWDPDRQRFAPAFLLNGRDNFLRQILSTELTSQADVWNDYGINNGGASPAQAQAAYQRFLTSKVYTDANYRAGLLSTSAWYDIGAAGEKISPFQRALAFHTAVGENNTAARLAVFSNKEFSQFANLMKNLLPDDSGSSTVKAQFRMFGVVGLATGGATLAANGITYVHNLPSNEEEAYKQIWNDFSSRLTVENLESAAYGMAMSGLAAGTVSLLFGEVGMCMLLAAGVAFSFESLRESLHELRDEVYPESEELSAIIALMDETSDTVAGVIESITPDFIRNFREAMIVDGLMTGRGTATQDYMVGFDAAEIFGNEGNDILAHLGFGKIDGGAGNDFIVAAGGLLNSGGDGGVIDGGDGEDWLFVLGHGVRYVKGGAGNDLVGAWGSVLSGGEGNSRDNWIFVDAGLGDDIILPGVSSGSEIWVGSGANTVYFSSDVLVHDMDADDVVSWFGIELTGGFRHGDSDSPWMSGAGGFFQYAKNGAHQLAIVDPLRLVYDNWEDRTLWIDNFEDSLNGASTAGIHLFEYTFEVQHLIGNTFPHGWWNESWRTIVGHMAKSLTGTSFWEGIDPLVLDLDGDGLELSSVSYGGPTRFDMDGDGFAEPTGWVKSDDGFLVRDENANGTIDGIGDLIGSPSQNGFAELSAFDTNADQIIDATEAAAAGLQVWRDLNQNQISEANELTSLAAAGISSISLNVTATPGKTNVTNAIAGEAQFTRADGTTGTVSDVRFRIDNFITTYLGDKTVSTRAAMLPNLTGRGTLADLRVALTLDEAATSAANPGNPAPGQPGHVADLIEDLPGLMANFTGSNLGAWRAAAMPIFTRWMAAMPLPANADPVTADLGTEPRADIHVITRTDDSNAPKVVDFAYRKHVTWTEDVNGVPTQMSGDYWYFASGRTVKDAGGNTIAHPSLAEALATPLGTNESYDMVTGVQIQFLERFLGDAFDIDPTAANITGALTPAIAGLEQLFSQFNRAVVRLGVQGPQAGTTFAGISYDPVEDDFNPTTDRGLVPVFEQVFTQANASGGLATVKSWQEILAFVVSEFDRGEDYLQVTASYLFANIVAAHENVQPSFGLVDAAGLLGIDRSGIKTGAGTVNGTGDAEIFYLGAGDQTVIGEANDDAYVIGKDFGHDEIQDIEGVLSNRGQDIIRFAQYKSTDVEAFRDGTDLIIRTKVGDNELRIKRQFEGIAPALLGGDYSDDTGVTNIVFVDGVSWDMGDMAKAVSHTSAADETIIGTDTIDYLDGGAGNDHLSGGDWGDVYIFGRGYGQDSIQEAQSDILVDSTDILAFAPGIKRSDLVFSRDGNSKNLKIGFKDTTDQLTIQGQFYGSYSGLFDVKWMDRIEVFAFEKDFDLTANQIMDILITQSKTDGNDTIYGFDRQDRLDGGAGNDYLSGGEENDTYVFGLGYGQDVIRDYWTNLFSGHDDTLEIKDVNLADATFQRTTTSHDVTISLSDGSTVTLNDQFDGGYLGVGNPFFMNQIENIAFKDTTLTANQLMDRLIQQSRTDGDDAIYGFDRDDVLDGGAGNDYLAGGDNGDTYVFGLGYGQDTVYDMWWNVFGDTEDSIQFGEGISAANIKLWRSGNSVIVSVLDTDDSLTIRNQVWSGQLGNRDHEIEKFRFADGTVWGRTEIQNVLLQSTNGEDVISGFSSGDWLDGGAGNDLLKGENGSDVYVFDRGYGHDIVDDYRDKVFSSDNDVIQFGEGITFADLVLSRSGMDVVITIADTGESITIAHQAAQNSIGPDWRGIEALRFSDGSTVTQWTLFNILATGTDANDSITGSEYGEVVTGGKGDDQLAGDQDGDTYAYARGDGHDTITEYSHGRGIDRLKFSNVNQSDVSLQRNGLDLTVVVNESSLGAGDGGSVLLKTTLDDADARGVEEVEFADGTIWTRADLRALVLAQAATNGNDAIVGFNVADVIAGGKGDDTLTGGNGGDSYVYARGDGSDTISEYYYGYGTDQLVFFDINPGEVLLVRNGIDVTVAIGESSSGAGDAGSILLLNGLDGNYVDQIVFADGTIWSQADLRTMVLAPTMTSGNDTIQGFSVADTISGGAGNDAISAGGGSDQITGGEGDDTLSGDSGGDSYFYSRGDGHDIISEYTLVGGGTDKLILSDINPADVSLLRVDDDVTIVISESAPGAGDAGSILLKYGLDGNSIEQIVFADGTTWVQATLRTMLITAAGTAGDDTVSGSSAADIISGGLGNDVLAGDAGGDTYLYSRGDGNDTINEYTLVGSGYDKLIFADINPEAISLIRDGDNVTIVIGESSPGAGDAGSVYLRYGLNGNCLEQILFADGTIWTQADLRVRVLADASTIGNDTIAGFGGLDDVITGGGGDDVLAGNGGADSYLYARGDGNDVINEYTLVDGNPDKLIFSDINPEDVSLVRDGSHVTIVIGESSAGAGDAGSVYLRYGLAGNSIEQVIFADGTIWTQADLRIRSIADSTTAGDDTIIGFGGVADTISGGKGNDTLAGDSGGDTYLYARGDGNDVINEYTLVGGGYDNLVLSDVESSEVFMVRNGDHVTIVIPETLPGAGDAGSIYLRYGLIGNSIEYISFADGVTWTQAILRSEYMSRATTAGDDVITGFSSNDSIFGGGGNDTLDGSSGADSLTGGTGDDTYIIDTTDTLAEGLDEGTDTVRISASYTLLSNFENLILTGSSGYSGTGNELDNILTGNGGANALTGGLGNDTLNGGAGADTLLGGQGDDIYVVDHASDVTTEVDGEGVDLVQSSVTRTLSANIENLVLTGAAAINGTGNELDNMITGNGANNVLDGAAGVDTLAGGTGNDTYIVDNSADLVIENAIEGVDLVQASATFQLSANVENLTLTGSSAIDGTGNELDNLVMGNAGINVLSGGAGNDTLNGGAGADSLIGGLGDDIFVVDNAGDAVTEAAEEGIDLVQSSVTVTLSDNVENLVLTGTGAIGGTGNALGNALTGNSGVNTLSGGAGNDTLNGAAGADTLIGGLGDDTYIVDNASDATTEAASEGTDSVQSSITWTLAANLESLTLTGAGNINGTGNAAVNTITGNAGNNTLSGGAGADTLSGGLGNDIYVVDDAGDVAAEAENEGTDTVQSSIAFTLGANLENLTLTGSAAIDGTGNTLDNVITGNTGVNTLTGGDGNDTLNGGTGADTLLGGTGNDTYVVDNAGDVPTENADEGMDLIQASITWTLGANLENLTLTGSSAINGTGNVLDNVITGNSGNNVLNGGAGADTLVGGAGNDTYVVDADDVVIEAANQGNADLVQSAITWTLSANIENLTLTGAAAVDGTGNVLDNVIIGNTSANTLAGNDGNDTLNGGAGADTLIGGLGNDIYVVDDAGDAVSEIGNAGTDTVQSSLTYTLGADLENLTLTGSSAINGTGNALDNILTGNTGINLLTGGDGNDTLNGGTGADTLVGGTGNDTYVVDNAGDQTTESADEGIDTVQSSIAWTLGANLENLTLSGSSGVAGTGNALDNVITGNSGNNALTGGAGNDRLDGGSGNDAMAGGIGDDTYIVQATGDAITENAAEGIDTIESSITISTLAANVENLTLTGTSAINGTGNALDNFITGNSGVNILTGGAGNDTLNGAAGADSLNGGDGNDIVEGGLGNDTLSGGQGADEFRFGLSAGADTVDAYDTDGGADKLAIDAGVATDQLWFSQAGNDLLMTIIGTNDTVTVQGWYSSTDRQLDRIQLSDGKYATASDVEQLRSAMVSFSPPPLGQMTLDSAVLQSLTPTLAAAWH
ncbi:calcium-binding protein [Dongia sp.]|uniref:calcium-binding protein n=1 Tax=Dongia sp. TaxID=1977262 RepID=UPI0035B06B95